VPFLKVLVTSMLLLNLAMVLAADIFASDKHEVDQSYEVAFNQKEKSSIRNVVSFSQNGQCSPDSCYDPCHTGNSHFGHQFVTFKSIVSLYLFRFPIYVGNASYTQSKIEEPFLGSLRRPPKYV